MRLPWRTVPSARRPHIPHQHVRHIADARPFAAGDVLILREKLDRGAPPILTRPLKERGRIDTHNGVLLHDDLIGKRVRDVVQSAHSRSGKPTVDYRLHEVKLEEYVRLSRRLVTPIYAADARLIVELLDLHVEPYDASVEHSNDLKLEILEAGTGHGALTLYLSRAINAANPPLPDADVQDDSESQKDALAEWKTRRRALIHTMDAKAKYSAHAANVVKGFKRGMYHNNVDFHVADVGEWVEKTLLERGGRPFLSHAILDLPNADAYLKSVANALRTDGCLIVFNPSMTQIIDCVKKIRKDDILFELDNVIELGVNGGSGGREWNVRAVKPRARVKAESNGSRQGDDSDPGEDAVSDVTEESVVRPKAADADWSMICRPKVGDRIVGGGFLAVLRKQRDMTALS